MKRSLALIALFGFLVLCGAATSGAPQGKVEMTLEQYQALTTPASGATADADAKPPLKYSFESVAYAAEVRERDLRVTAKARVFVAEGKWTAVPLFAPAEGVAIESFVGAVKSIAFDEASGKYQAVLEGPGAHEFTYTLTAALAGATSRTATFPTPNAVATSLAVNLPEGEQVTVVPALALREEAVPSGRFLHAQIAPSPSIAVSVGPPAGEAYAFTRADYLATETTGGMLITADLALSVTHYPAEGIAVLDRGQALAVARVDGKDHPVTAGKTAFMLGRLAPGVRAVHLEWFMPFGSDETSRTLAVPVLPVPITTFAVSVAGEAMEVDIKPGLNRRVESKSGRTKVTVNLPMVTEVKASWSGRSPETRKLGVEKEDVRMYAERLAAVRLEEGLLTITDTVEFKILRGEAGEVWFTLPAGTEVVSVEGSFIKSWTQEAVTEGRRCRVFLDRRVRESYSLKVVYEMLLKEPPLSDLALPMLAPGGVEREKGIVAIQSSPDLEVKPNRTENLRRVEVDRTNDLRRLAPLYAYQYLNRPYALSVEVALKPAPDPDVQAEVATLANVSEGFIEAMAMVDYAVLNTGVDTLTVALPPDVKVTAVRGQMIRNQEQGATDGRGFVTVYLERPVLGHYRLYLEYQRQLGADLRKVEIPFVRPEGVSATEGFVGISVSGNLELVDGPHANLRLIDLSQLRGSIFQLSETMIARSYSYSWTPKVNQDPKLGFEVRRYSDVSVQDAFIDEARYLTLVHEDNFCVTKAVLSIRNKNRQNLKLTLPPNSELWSAFLANEPVPPAKDSEGNILIPLPKSDTGESGQQANFPVEVVYKTTFKDQGRFGELELLLPSTDITLGKAVWQLYLPPDRTYRDFGGNLGPVIREDRSGSDASQDLARFALSLSGNFLRFQAKAKQSEPKTNLGAIFTAQISRFQEKGEYGASFREIRWNPEGRNMYSYVMGGDRIRSAGAPDFLPEIQSTAAGAGQFLALAIGNIDNDPFPDIWAINQDKKLVNLADDANDAYSPEFEEMKAKGMLGEFDLEQLAAIQERLRQSELRGMLSLKIEVPTRGTLVRFEKLFPGAQNDKSRVEISYLPKIFGQGARFISRLFAVVLGGGMVLFVAVMVRRHPRLGFFRRHWWLTLLVITGALVLVFRTWFV